MLGWLDWSANKLCGAREAAACGENGSKVVGPVGEAEVLLLAQTFGSEFISISTTESTVHAACILIQVGVTALSESTGHSRFQVQLLNATTTLIGGWC